MTIQYGLRHLGGYVSSYPSEKDALAAQTRMKKFECTRHTTLVWREQSDWQDVQ